MSIELLRKRLSTDRASFIEPCLTSPADKPPSGSNWIHEIKHDGFRLMARRDSAGIRLITRGGHDWSQRYPLVVEAVNHLKVRSCLIDGEVVCCDERGLATFQLLRHRRNEPQALLYAFDLLELNGADLRREPIEVRKATLASILRKSRPGNATRHVTRPCRHAQLPSPSPPMQSKTHRPRCNRDRPCVRGMRTNAQCYSISPPPL
jgi:ATP-dependent DNA ligase